MLLINTCLLTRHSSKIDPVLARLLNWAMNSKDIPNSDGSLSLILVPLLHLPTLCDCFPWSWLPSRAAGQHPSPGVCSEALRSVSTQCSPVWHAWLWVTQGNTDLDPRFSACISEDSIANCVCRGFLHGLCMKLWTKGQILVWHFFCIQFEKCWQLPFGPTPVSFLFPAEDNFLTQLFSNTSRYSR